jgi:hypothetical protein
LCESITMACVIGLWIWAWLRGHPAGRPMLVAIGVSIAAAMLRLVPGAAALLRLDPDSAYHLGQIVGMVLLFRAVARSGPRPEPVYDTPSGRTSQTVGPSPTSVDSRRRPTRWMKATQLRRRHFLTRH